MFEMKGMITNPPSYFGSDFMKVIYDSEKRRIIWRVFDSNGDPMFVEYYENKSLEDAKAFAEKHPKLFKQFTTEGKSSTRFLFGYVKQ